VKKTAFDPKIITGSLIPVTGQALPVLEASSDSKVKLL